jgi:pilus assembly protein Flp/PilA
MVHLRAFLRDDRGATSIEYGMIALFLSILCVVGATAIGSKLQAKWLGPLSAAFS